jgi:hypothetical protein
LFPLLFIMETKTIYMHALGKNQREKLWEKAKEKYLMKIM